MGYRVSFRNIVRFLGNSNTTEFHDLVNENRDCQIDEIFRAGHGVGFDPDTAQQARSEGFDPCAWCMPGQSRR